MHARVALAAVLVACAACGNDYQPTGAAGGSNPPPPPSTSVASVSIQDFSFSPGARTVTLGTTVRWTNNGPSGHTTTSNSGVWNSGTLGAPGGGAYGGGGSGGTYQYTFSAAGTYAYHCAVHPQMTGTITVSP